MNKSREIVKLAYLVKSCQNNLDKKYGNKYIEQVDQACSDYCKEHNIKITHGSAFKELRHKMYYYVDKNIKSIIDNGIDVYTLYENKIITSKQIVDTLLKKGGKV